MKVPSPWPSGKRVGPISREELVRFPQLQTAVVICMGAVVICMGAVVICMGALVICMGAGVPGVRSSSVAAWHALGTAGSRVSRHDMIIKFYSSEM